MEEKGMYLNFLQQVKIESDVFALSMSELPDGHVNKVTDELEQSPIYGWHAHPEKKYAIGWLQDPKRKDRREKEDTLTAQEVGVFIQKIQVVKNYSKLDLENDKLLRLRDQAAMALWWIFFKRGGEMLALKAKHVVVADKKLVVTYSIEKKKRFVLLCGSCGFENRRRSRKDSDDKYVTCQRCNQSLEISKRETRKEIVTRIKRRSLRDPLTQYVIAWKECVDKMSPGPESWFFSGFQYFKNCFLWESKKPLTIQWLDWMLQKTEPSLTSSMARYGHTEQLFKAKTPGGSPKYSVDAITNRGDWESYDMPMLYRKKKGLTQAELEFEEDTEA